MDEKLAREAAALIGSITGDVAPIDRLQAAKRLRELAEQLERQCGRDAHTAGVSWTVVGELYGASRQAMRERFTRA